MRTPIKFSGIAKQFPMENGWAYLEIPNESLPPIMPDQGAKFTQIIATVGSTTWDSSILPIGNGNKFITLKKEIREKEKIKIGDKVTIEFKIK